MTRVLACLCLLLLLVGCVRLIPPGAGMLCPNYRVLRGRPPPPPSVDLLAPRLVATHRGDREFNGHGPNINIDVEFCISLNYSDPPGPPDSANNMRCVTDGETGRRIIAVITYLAEETNPDGSRAGDGSMIRQQFVRPVFPRSWDTIPADDIASIDSPTTAHISTRSPPAGYESPPCSDGDLIDPTTIRITQRTGGPVSSVALIGDTGWKDISNDDNCRCDTRVNSLVFNEVAFTLAGGSSLRTVPDGPPIPVRDPGDMSVPGGHVDPVDWSTGGWTACTDGTRTRSVSCVALLTGAMVDAARCVATAGSRPPESEPCGGTMPGSCYFVSPSPLGSGYVSTCLLRDPDSSGSRELVECRPSWCEGNTLKWYTCGPDAGNYVFGDRAMANTLACSSAGCGPASGFLSRDPGRAATMQSGNACVE